MAAKKKIIVSRPFRRRAVVIPNPRLFVWRRLLRRLDIEERATMYCRMTDTDKNGIEFAFRIQTQTAPGIIRYIDLTQDQAAELVNVLNETLDDIEREPTTRVRATQTKKKKDATRR